MTDTTNGNSQPSATPASVWTSIADSIAAIGKAVEALLPTQTAAIDIAVKIVQGVLDGVPTALTLYDSIVKGQQPTAADLAAYTSDYEAAYAKLQADIAAALVGTAG